MRRWFVTLTNHETEDVGAHYLDYDEGALIFSNIDRIPTWIYAGGTWRFVEYQDDE